MKYSSKSSAAPAMSLASTEIDIQSIITGKQSALHQIGLDLSVMRSSTATLPTSRQLWSPDYYRQHESDTYFDLYHTIDSGMHELHRVFYHMPTYHFNDHTREEVNQVLTCFAFDMLTRGRTEMHALLSIKPCSAAMWY